MMKNLKNSSNHFSNDNMKKLAIFDFDGTLFDSIDDVVVCFNKVLTIYGFPTLTRDEYIPCLGGNIDDIVSKVLGDNNTPQNLEKVKKTYLDLYNTSKKELTIPFNNSYESLKILQDNNVLLAINSNRLNDSLNEFVDKFFPDIDFILIEGHDNVNPSKPDPFGVNKIIDKAKVDLDETVYIGDSITDIKTAQNAGIDCVVVKWGYGDENVYNQEYPLKVISDFSQLYELFGINYF